MKESQTKTVGTIGLICNLVKKTVNKIIPESTVNDEVTSTIVFNTVMNNINKKKEA